MAINYNLCKLFAKTKVFVKGMVNIIIIIGCQDKTKKCNTNNNNRCQNHVNNQITEFASIIM